MIIASLEYNAQIHDLPVIYTGFGSVWPIINQVQEQ